MVPNCATHHNSRRLVFCFSRDIFDFAAELRKYFWRHFVDLRSQQKYANISCVIVTGQYLLPPLFFQAPLKYELKNNAVGTLIEGQSIATALLLSYYNPLSGAIKNLFRGVKSDSKFFGRKYRSLAGTLDEDDYLSFLRETPFFQGNFGSRKLFLPFGSFSQNSLKCRF